MKCSLLTLSTFIDGELAPQRRAEVDAHLVGCTRCGAGAATLREEKKRIGQLARVSVDSASAQLMLEQVGISVDPAADLPPATPPPPAVADEHRPWQGGTSSPSLPWTPRRPEPVALTSASDEIVVAPAVAPEVNPYLPLDGVRSVPPSWDRAPADDPAPPVPLESAGAIHDSPPAQEPEWAEADDEWLDAAPGPDSWEADLPTPTDSAPSSASPGPPLAPPPSVEPLAPPVPATAPHVPRHMPPPTRLAAASGPAGLVARIRDAVSVRLALARGGDALEDSVQIVSGAPSRRGVQLPVQEPEAG
ncbi:MAG: zf-HC2 domain-containing protein, partial [Candidatus Dormibacteraeota bacterium]|nr:zf-HC2 domain-containing protein [Candidatus Dormibacteraeota bacterium]